MAGLKNWLMLLLFVPLFFRFPCIAVVDAYHADFPSANISASWKNNVTSEKGSVKFNGRSNLGPILLVYNESYPPFDGNPVWSTNTSRRSITRMEKAVGGNLNGSHNDIVWQSFDHPTDTWFPNQKIYNNQKLTTRNSSSNLSTAFAHHWVPCAGSITPLSCTHGSRSHSFVKLYNVAYFDFVPMFFNTTVETCEDACLSNYSCKVAFFRYIEDVSSGNCSLQSDELYSFMAYMKKDSGFNFYAFIKVQKVPDENEKKHASLVPVLVPSLLGALVLVTLVARTCYRYTMLKTINDVDEESGDDDQVTEALTKFSFEEMKSSTQNFQTKLGQGGFGSVFEGILYDGTKVAVKCLDSIGQGRKEFMAEVSTMGKVDHFNLVELIGYCAEKSNKLLVYEHMCNGSLDKWIFNLDRAKRLGWQIRQKIIYGVAKGLEYLHEQCSRNIIHFDIKPQNILLDEDFNAKISDFGLAKLIDRNQSLVLTTLKGTPGYLAPELFGGLNVSIKADVYSFGIVILETVCGRKNLDSYELMPLINIVKLKAEEDQLYDLFSENDVDIRCHKEEAIKMIRIGIWCLQSHDKRPCMSMVVKVLEGLTNLDLITDYQFLTASHIGNPIQVNSNISDPPEASILSGPR